MFRFCRRRAVLSMFLILLLPLVCLAEGGTLYLQKNASFDKGLKVPDAIRSDCRLETKIVDFVEFFAKEDFDRIAIVENASATRGKALALTITNLACEGGGAWSGPKHLSIAGTLWQDGKVIGTFTAQRVTGGGLLGAYRGTCQPARPVRPLTRQGRSRLAEQAYHRS